MPPPYGGYGVPIGSPIPMGYGVPLAPVAAGALLGAAATAGAGKAEVAETPTVTHVVTVPAPMPAETSTGWGVAAWIIGIILFLLFILLILWALGFFTPPLAVLTPSGVPIVPPTVPPPTNLVATATPTQTTITWTAPTGITSFQLTISQIATPSGPTSPPVVVVSQTVVGTTYLFTTGVSGDTYMVSVQSISSTGATSTAVTTTFVVPTTGLGDRPARRQRR